MKQFEVYTKAAVMCFFSHNVLKYNLLSFQASIGIEGPLIF